MKMKLVVAFLAIFSMAAVISIPTGLIAQKAVYEPNKELCAQMIAAGKEYYMRGKYLDAKNYFRKAVEADPSSQKAWRYYDQTVIFALAEKVEKSNDLLVPDTSIRSDVGSVIPKRPAITSPPIEMPHPAPTPSAGAPAPTVEEGC